jgi:sugar phosphate permease
LHIAISSCDKVILLLFFLVGAVMAGYPLGIVTKSYDWDGMMMLLEAVSLLAFGGLLCARNVSRDMSLSIKVKEA